jgi:long-chain acyl-CoA synthetase
MMSGGYKLPASLRERFEQKLKIPIYEGYGLTEASPAFTCQSPIKPFDKDSIGRVMVNYQVKIVDEAGNEVPFGQKGEIWFHGDTIMKGYFNCPEATKQKIAGGWLRTGDYGKLDKEGNVFFLGLKKKMFNVAGNKVYPAEVKRLMMKNGNIASIELRSEYNDLTGDSVKATISFKNNAPSALADLRAWCSAMLTKYKTPSSMISG